MNVSSWGARSTGEPTGERSHEGIPLAPNIDETDGQQRLDIDSDEEVQPQKVKESPSLPSRAEVEEHRVTHLPFRNWCRECVEGKALGEHRHPREGHGSKVPVVGIDYFYMTSKGLQMRSELIDFPETAEGEVALLESRKKGEIVKCIIVRCSHSKNIFAHVVPYKGVDEGKLAVKLVTEDIAWLGHTRLIVKADNEASLKKLVQESLKGAQDPVQRRRCGPDWRGAPGALRLSEQRPYRSWCQESSCAVSHAQILSAATTIESHPCGSSRLRLDARARVSLAQRLEAW